MTTRAPLGIRRDNPGNIEHIASTRWQGAVEPHDGHRFEAFIGPEWGIRAICRILIAYQDKYGLDTIHKIVSRWAPPSENDTNSYASHVSSIAGVGVNEALDVYNPDTMYGLLRGIIAHENGRDPYDDATIARGMMLAGIEVPGQTVYSLFKPQPKPLRKSSTVQGGSAAMVGAGGMGVVSVLDWLWGRIGDADTIQLIFAGVVLVGVAVMVYGYMRARREGRVDVATT